MTVRSAISQTLVVSGKGLLGVAVLSFFVGGRAVSESFGADRLLGELGGIAFAIVLGAIGGILWAAGDGIEEVPSDSGTGQSL